MAGTLNFSPLERSALSSSQRPPIHPRLLRNHRNRIFVQRPAPLLLYVPKFIVELIRVVHALLRPQLEHSRRIRARRAPRGLSRFRVVEMQRAALEILVFLPLGHFALD